MGKEYGKKEQKVMNEGESVESALIKATGNREMKCKIRLGYNWGVTCFVLRFNLKSDIVKNGKKLELRITKAEVEMEKTERKDDGQKWNQKNRKQKKERIKKGKHE